MGIQFLDSVQHDNIIQLVDIFHVDESETESSLTIVTGTVNETLKHYLDNSIEYIEELVSIPKNSFLVSCRLHEASVECVGGLS
jgi:hypothetical protein